jgi:hypothetical protein
MSHITLFSKPTIILLLLLVSVNATSVSNTADP